MSEKNLDRILDQAIDEIAQARMDPAAEKAAVDQVWARLSQELVEDAPADQKILGHGDFEALIPAFVKGELSGAKAMLLQDHVGECVPCRRALKNARTGGGRKPAATVRAPRSAAAVWGWRVAAAAIVAASSPANAFAAISINRSVLLISQIVILSRTGFADIFFTRLSSCSASSNRPVLAKAMPRA